LAQRRTLVELLIDRVLVDNGDVEIRYVIPTSPRDETTRFYQLRKDYFEMPLVTWFGVSATQLMGICLTKLPAPFTDGFVGDHHTADKQQFFHIPVAKDRSINYRHILRDSSIVPFW
jgi:hypothetical protein